MLIFKKITEVKKQFNLEFSNVKNIKQLEKLDNKFLSRKIMYTNPPIIIGINTWNKMALFFFIFIKI